MRKLIILLIASICLQESYAQQSWTYLRGNGSDFADVYGTVNQYHPNNTPGLRLAVATWQLNGKLYLFGGQTYSLTGALGQKNDLWEYDTASRNWRWIKGSTSTWGTTVYGTKGVANSANTPGARSSCATWVYNNKLYLFGGSTDELWVFDPATDNWTWLSGNDGNNKGVYGVKGVAAITNQPGAREAGAYWLYNNKFYVYGGSGNDSLNSGVLNDIWEYNPASDLWTWIAGDKTIGVNRVPGTMGVPSAANNPGYRTLYNWWFNNGKFYRQGGGFGFAHSSSNEMWEYNMATGNWTWIKGTLTTQLPVYGTQGTPAAANTPGGRLSAVTWVNNNKLYLLGGTGDENTNDGVKDDLWQYDPATNNWTWMQGSKVAGASPVYGMKGFFGGENYMGSRTVNAVWQMADRAFVMGGLAEEPSIWGYIKNDLWEHEFAGKQWRWLKGMDNQAARDVYGYQGLENYLNTPSTRKSTQSWQVGDSVYVYAGFSVHNDAMWRYNIRTNDWACIKGIVSDTPRYGTKGGADKNNSPGKLRNLAATWTLNNKLYLFGGWGTVTWADLWEYDLATNNWRLLKDNNKSRMPVYGTKGVAAANNTPGYRAEAMYWTCNGKLYLFGGEGTDKNGSTDLLNDLWEYDPATNNWTWLKGSDTKNQYGVYGTQGVAHANNTPGSRRTGTGQAIGGKLYLFGGNGYSSLNGFPSTGYQSDLWEYDPATNNWRWLKGVDYGGAPTTFGTKGVASATNKPGGRMQGVSWSFNDKFYMFGGNGFITNPSGGMTNDLWEYNPATNNWTWISGSNLYYQNGYYNLAGAADANNVPGSRCNATAWTSGNRLYLMGGEAYPVNTNYSSSFEKNDIWYYEACTSLSQCYPGAPVIGIDSSIEVCPGKTLILNAGNSGSKYEWNTGDSSRSIGISVPGKYWVKVTNPANLSSTDTVVVTTGMNPVVNLGNDTTICSGTPFWLDAQNAGAAYYWNTGEVARSINVKDAGSYFVSVVKSNSCVATDTIEVAVNQGPGKPSASGNTPLCEGDTLYLLGTSVTTGVTNGWTGPGGFAASSQNVDRLNIGVADSGDYIFTDTLNGCMASDTVHIKVNPSVMPAVTIAASPSANAGPTVTVTFSANVTNGGTATTYQWKKNGANIPAATAGTYNAVMGIDLQTNDQVSLLITSNETCANPDTALSNSVTTTIDLDVKALRKSSFKVYPNPAKEVLHVSNLTTSSIIRIMDGMGKVMYKTEVNRPDVAIPLNTFCNGVYMLHITNKTVNEAIGFTICR